MEITAKCTEKQMQLIRQLESESLEIIKNAREYAEKRLAEGKKSHANRILSAANDLETIINNGVHDHLAGASLWISMVIAAKSNNWLECRPK